MTKGITLIGMPGSGKSTIGKLLAKDLDLKFLDLDDVIKEKTGKSPNDYLEKFGDEAIIDLEEKLTLEQNLRNKIFSPGGSIIYKDKAMKKIKEETLVIYLKISLSALKPRLKNMHSKGVVGLKRLGFKKVYEERSPMYQKSADVIIEEKGQSAYKITRQILFKYSLPS